MSRIGILSLVVTAAAACSDMNSTDETYETVYGTLQGGGSGSTPGNGGTDQGMGGGGSNGEPPLDPVAWGCLEDGIEMPAPTPARVKYQVNIVDFDSQPVAPIIVPNLVVEVCTTSSCDRLLPPCDTSVSAPTPTQQCAIVTQGAVPVSYTIDLPFRLENGGLKLTAVGYAQMNYIFGGPMVGTPEGAQTVVGLTIPLLTEEARTRAYRQVRIDAVDPTRGTLAVRTLSCARQPATPTPMPVAPQGQRATGIRVAAELEPPPPAKAWSLSNGNQFTGDRLVTDARGVAGFLNVEAGSIQVSAELQNGDEYSVTTLPVVANVITLAELRPGLEQWGQ